MLPVAQAAKRVACGMAVLDVGCQDASGMWNWHWHWHLALHLAFGVWHTYWNWNKLIDLQSALEYAPDGSVEIDFSIEAVHGTVPAVGQRSKQATMQPTIYLE